MSLPQERSTAEQVFYTWVAQSRSGSSSFTASALNKPSSSSSSSSTLLKGSGDAAINVRMRELEASAKQLLRHRALASQELQGFRVLGFGRV